LATFLLSQIRLRAAAGQDGYTGRRFYHPELIVSLARLMLILPLLLCLILFATGVPRMAGWVADSGTLLVVVLGAGGALLLVLAQVFNQGRIGHMALLVLASFALQHYGLPAPGVAYSGPAYWLLFWLALLLPLNIVLIRWLPEYRPWSVGALSWPGWVGARGAGYWLVRTGGCRAGNCGRVVVDCGYLPACLPHGPPVFCLPVCRASRIPYWPCWACCYYRHWRFILPPVQVRRCWRRCCRYCCYWWLC